MKALIYISLLFISAVGFSQNTVQFKVVGGGQNELLLEATVTNVSQSKIGKNNGVNDFFVVEAALGDSIQVKSYGYKTKIEIVDSEMLSEKITEVKLKTDFKEFGAIEVESNKYGGFDFRVMPTLTPTAIKVGTNSVISLTNQSGAKSTGNPRELFAKIPGINIWESDGAGIQIGVGGRGLSPNRAANFTTRQNGYDISADALGYPESYYTPPLEGLKAVEITRGSASLQYGTQFGGLLNFVMKDPAGKKIDFTTRNTVGSYGYFGSFNRVSGSHRRIEYQAYYQRKSGNGYRENGEFNQTQIFAQLGYYLSDNIRLRVEYTHMNYLAHQSGGLTDAQFNEDARQSIRERNWFYVNWNLLATHFDWEISKTANFNIRAFGMLSSRKSLGFLGKISQQDPGGNRQLISGEFKNAGTEARFLKKYNLSSDEKSKAAFLVGARYYQGETTSTQGSANDGDEDDFYFLNPDEVENSQFSFPSQNFALFWDNVFFVNEKWTFNAGARFEYIKSSSNGFYKDYDVHPITYDTLAIYKIEDGRTNRRTVLLAGAGASYKIDKNSKVYTNIVQNYRAVNFNDIRINNPNVAIDTLIKDEKGGTVELGYRNLIKNYWLIDAAVFGIFYGDKIGLAPIQGQTKKLRTNIGDALNYGIELFTEFDFIKFKNQASKNGFSIFANLSWIQAKYIRSQESSYVGNSVEYVPNYILRGGLKYKSPKFSVQVQGSYTAEQFSDATNAVNPSGDAVIGLVPSYFVLDVSSRYIFNEIFSLELSVNNATNSSYFTRRATAYPGPGIIPSDGVGIFGTLQINLQSKD